MNSLKAKLSMFQGAAGLGGILILFIVIWFSTQQRVLSNAITNAENTVDQIAYSISILLAQGGDTAFNYQRLIEKIATLDDIRSIKVLDTKGVILADNDPEQIGQTFTSPLIINAIDHLQKEQEINGQTLTIIRPLHGETYSTDLKDVTGLLWIELDLGPAFSRAQNDILSILLMSMGGFLVIFFWYSRITDIGILKRLDVLSQGLFNAEKGNLTHRISVGKLFGSTDEINNLASQFNQMTTSLERKLTFEELTTHLAARFMNVSSSEIGDAIQDMLRRLGKLFEVDRTYIFEYSEDGKVMNNTHEWCAKGISPQIEGLQQIPVELTPWWNSLLAHGEYINIPKVSDMQPEAYAEKAILEEQGIQSVLVIPITSDTGLFGFMGLDSVINERNWSKDEIQLLLVLAGIVINTITRQRSQQEVMGQRDFALQIMDTVKQGLTVLNTQGVFEYVNPAYAQMLKRTSEQLIGRSPAEFTYADDKVGQDYEWNKRQSGFSSSYPNRLVAADGNIIHVLISATPRIRDGHIVGSIASVTDLTEQLKAEEKLRESEARNRAFLSAVPDLIFRIDKHGTFLDYKVEPDKKLYISPNTIIGSTVEKSLPPDISSATMSAIQKALENKTPQVFEYKLQTVEGLFIYEARVVSSAPDEVIIVAHDITDRARLEQMKTDFINRASHELRTPLTTALLMVNLLDMTDLTQEDEDNYWDILKKELERERGILEDVLTVGRLESGKYRAGKEPVSILPILNSAINTMRPMAELHNIKINVHVEENTSSLYGPEDVFTHIFNNIISNAVKFSLPNEEIHVNISKNEDEMFITVKDRGIGIPPEDLPHITSRFFRGTNATEMEIPGSGIGLYIIKSIVEELGGKLNIQSQVNEGTTISISIPQNQTT